MSVFERDAFRVTVIRCNVSMSCELLGSTMLSWKLILLYCFINMCTTQRRNKALFPNAVRIKRGLPKMMDPVFHKSLEDVHLLFEILLSGLQFVDNNGGFSVKDAELASLRKTKTLEVICEDVVPRKLTDIHKLTANLLGHIGQLPQGDFERVLLTMVYTAQNVITSTSDHQRHVWAESFVSLYKALKQDLTKAH